MTYDRSGKSHETRIGGKRPRKAIAGRSHRPRKSRTLGNADRDDGFLLQGVPQRGIRRIVPQAGDGPGQEASITASSRKAGNLGLRNRANHRVGQLPGRSKPEASPEAALHRPGFRRGGKHRTGQVQDDSDNVQDSNSSIHKWTLPSKMDENPMVWMLEVNGFLMDIRHAPRELQEAAFEKGLIPYIPADGDEARNNRSRKTMGKSKPKNWVVGPLAHRVDGPVGQGIH